MKIADLTGSFEAGAIKVLEKAGHEGYFVGGCVRDALMNREYNDIDVATSATPDEIKAAFSDCRTLDTGIRHGSVTVFFARANKQDKRIPIEITTFRTEGNYSDNRHPDSVKFVRNITEDLARRDFTMNAVACGIRGNIVDPFGGARDIKDKLIRAVKDPHIRFEEDALRIMRALRFGAQLGFEIEPITEAALLEKSPLLKNISKERIYTELKMLITAPFAGRIIDKYPQVLSCVLPHFGRMDGFQQHNPHHKYDLLRHCIHCLENIRTTPGNETYMKLAALFHDIGKPETFAYDKKGIGGCLGHPALSAIYVEEILRELKADSFTVQRVRQLTKHHDLIFREDPVLLKKLLNRFGPEVLLEILELKRADNLAIGCDVTKLIKMFDNIKVMIAKIIEEKQCYKSAHLSISGTDIISQTGARGRDVGIIIAKLLEAVIEGRVPNKKAPLLKEAALIYSQLS